MASATRRSLTRSQSSRAGIYVAGPFREPKDIPESVIEASGAAAAAEQLLAPARGTLARKVEYPPERDVTGEEPRVGVFVCHCGSNIGGFLDVPGMADYARSLPVRRPRGKQSLHLLAGYHQAHHRAGRKNWASTASSSHPARRARTSRCSRTPARRPGSTRTCSRWPTSATSARGFTRATARRRRDKAKDLVRMATARAARLGATAHDRDAGAKGGARHRRRRGRDERGALARRAGLSRASRRADGSTRRQSAPGVFPDWRQWQAARARRASGRRRCKTRKRTCAS